jgi:hypothetical protein
MIFEFFFKTGDKIGDFDLNYVQLHAYAEEIIISLVFNKKCSQKVGAKLQKIVAISLTP